MMHVARRRRLLTVTVALGLTACGSLVDIDTPGVITGDKLDPVRDGRIFSLSARQNFAYAYGQLILYSAWFTGEALSAETQPGPSEFDRRAVSADNSDLLALWTYLSVARESAERVVSGLKGSAGAYANIDRARAALFAGFSYMAMAEHFCQGAASGGPLLDSSQMLARANAYFSLAHDVAAAAIAGAFGDRAEASDIAAAALVGRARTRLQSGEHAGALADARQVPADFVMALWYSADPGNLARLANTIWFHTAQRPTLSVAPAFRDLNDPRVPVAPPSSDFPAFDGTTPFWIQWKYAGYDAAIRLTSGIEARYLAAEAQGAAEMLRLVQSRRAANGLPAYAGSGDDDAVTREFMNQRAREFFLEGKRLGDVRRWPGLVAGMPQPGAPYHKAGFPRIGDQTCWPLPTKEISR